MKYSFFLFTVFLFFSCSNGKTNLPLEDSGEIIMKDSLPTLDTTITLSNIKASKYNGINLTDSLAEHVLYDHFKKKGDILPDMQFDIDSLQTCIQYDALHFTDFNHNKYSDAIIEYTEALCGPRGYCRHPSKAIIIDGDNGYEIINEEFMPTDFCIDSVVASDKNVIVFGNDYNCEDNIILRHFKLTLK